MKRITFYIYILVFALLIQSCKNDKGNYAYDSLNTTFVDLSSMPKTVVLKQNDVAKIEPIYKSGNANSQFKYQWRLMTIKMATDPVTGGFYDEIVGTDKNLDFKVTADPGDYMLVLTVTDVAHGDITQLVKIPFTVSSYASVGWMVMDSKLDSSDVSVLVNPLVNVLVSPTTDYVQQDVFSETNGHKIFGQAKGINYVGNHWVDLYTDSKLGGYRSSGNDLRVLNAYSDMFVLPMAESDIHFEAWGSWSYNQLLVNNGDVFFISQANGLVYSKYGVRCFGEDYKAAPFVGTQFNFAYHGVFYDAKNKRFLYLNPLKEVKTFKAAGATAAFDLNKINMDMVYAEHGMDSKWFCVMQPTGNSSAREMLACRFNVTDDGNRGVGRYALAGATNFTQAKFFAFGHKANVMYYATDDKLYQNNYEGDRTSTLRMDIGTTYPGYKITNMRIFKVANHVNDGKLLYIALYNDTLKEGMLLQCQVNEVSGVINGTKAYKGFGRIGAMGYKAK